MATINIRDFKVGFTDQFFFDTNIWILLYGTVANFQLKDQKSYSKLLEELLSRDISISITSGVISEFANVILKRDFNQWVKNNKLVEQDFKRNFVGTNNYKNSVELITRNISSILKLPNIIKIPDNFNSQDLEIVLKNFELVDFNDAYIYEIAKSNNYKIVTNDKDFQKIYGNVTIITTQI